MGENEQGGMLRNVVVVGLVAMVAIVLIFAITGLKTTVTNQREDSVYKVKRAQLNGRNLLVGSKDYSGGHWNYVSKTADWHDGTQVIQATSASSMIFRYDKQHLITEGLINTKDKYQVSFDVNNTGSTPVTIRIYDSGTTDQNSALVATIPANSGWRRVSKTLTFWLVDGGQWTIGAQAMGVDPNGKLLASNIKFENGDEATGYYVG